MKATFRILGAIVGAPVILTGQTMQATAKGGVKVGEGIIKGSHALDAAGKVVEKNGHDWQEEIAGKGLVMAAEKAENAIDAENAKHVAAVEKLKALGDKSKESKKAEDARHKTKLAALEAARDKALEEAPLDAAETPPKVPGNAPAAVGAV